MTNGTAGSTKILPASDSIGNNHSDCR